MNEGPLSLSQNKSPRSRAKHAERCSMKGPHLGSLVTNYHFVTQYSLRFATADPIRSSRVGGKNLYGSDGLEDTISSGVGFLGKRGTNEYPLPSHSHPSRCGLDNRGRPSKYLLTGMARCAHCGGPMQIVGAKSGTHQ